MTADPQGVSGAQRLELVEVLETRFRAHPDRHGSVAWADVVARLEVRPAARRSLRAMEATEGEPDVIGRDEESGELLFCDCSLQSPSGRRSLCYDAEALAARKKNKPAGSAVTLAAEMGIALLTEDQYRALQELGPFDTTTSSWIQTPPDVRSNGGAIFCDHRYGRVSTYHNGAGSYYAARGFRGLLRV